MYHSHFIINVSECWSLHIYLKMKSEKESLWSFESKESLLLATHTLHEALNYPLTNIICFYRVVYDTFCVGFLRVGFWCRGVSCCKEGSRMGEMGIYSFHPVTEGTAER